MCQADDTPRYTGRLHDEAGEMLPVSGIGTADVQRLESIHGLGNGELGLLSLDP